MPPAAETQDPPALASALLRWTNSFDPDTKLEHWKDIRDGQLLWRALQDVEPDYFSGSLPEDADPTTDNWIPRWQNLKYLNRAAMAYIRDERGVYPHYIKRLEPDLKAIATESSKPDLLTLLKLVFLAAFFSPNGNARMVQIMMELGPEVGAPIAQWLASVETTEKALVEAADAQADTGSEFDGLSSPYRHGAQSPQPVAYDRDPELEREERLLRAQASIRELERQNMELITQLEEARGQQRSLEDELTEVKYRLERGGGLDASSDIVESLQSRANQDKDYIAQLEQDLEATKEAADALERQLQKLMAESDNTQRLRDELQLLRVERDELLQKTKANENLKKKIMSMQESEKNSLNIREDLEAAQEQLRMLETYKKRCANLQKANEENMKTLANTEQEIFDQRNTRKRLDHEIKLLIQRWDAAKEQKQRDAETIKDLQDKVADLETGGGRSMDDMNVLDEEDSVIRKKANAELKSKVAKLEAENLRLQEAGAAAADTSLSDQQKQRVESLQTRIEKLETQYLDAYQESLGLDSAIKGSEANVEDSHPFLHMRDRLLTETKLREDLEKKNFELEAQMADLKASVKSTETKLAVVDKAKAAAVEELKQGLEAETETLREENQRLLQYIKMSGEELDEQKGLLRHALLNVHALLREEPKVRSENETKLVLEELQQLKEKPESIEEVAKHLSNRIEDNRVLVKEAQAKATETQTRLEEQIMTLEAQLRKAKEEGSQAASTPLQENLQRELSLVTSAWYDMNSRLQSDAVVIQRRSEAPRSFLGRQRRLVSRT